MDTKRDDRMRITILGTRGSIPTSGRDMVEYGCATTCVLVQAGDQAIFLDAGTGIIKAPDVGEEHISVLISHPHLDHILGLPFFSYLTDRHRTIDLYARKTEGDGIRQNIDRVFDMPIWPCTMDDYQAKVKMHDVELPIMIGDVRIEGVESNHPGGGTVYKLTYKGKSIVFATDYEYDESKAAKLVELSRDTDVLFFDGQYTEKEIEEKRGYGHSTVKDGLKVMRESGAKSIRFVHHDPTHNDEMLRQMESEVEAYNIRFAREGEVFIL